MNHCQMCECMSSGSIFLESAYCSVFLIYFLSDSLSTGNRFNCPPYAEDQKLIGYVFGLHLTIKKKKKKSEIVLK